jgi:hypothetical protein
MISNGDLVKMTLSVAGDSNGSTLRQLFILGRMKNYCDEEETYILEPIVISVPKEQVSEIERLPEDFDFDDVSMEMRIGEQERQRETPSEITNIRLTRER